MKKLTTTLQQIVPNQEPNEKTNRTETILEKDTENRFPLIDFKLFEQPGILLVVGDSGRGKTSFSKALTYYLIEKHLFKQATVLSGSPTAYEYLLDKPYLYFNRTLNIDYPEIIKDIEKDRKPQIKKIYTNIKQLINNEHFSFYRPSILLFDVRKMLDENIYIKLINSFFEYFSEQEDQILVIDHLSSFENHIKQNPNITKIIQKASKKNLIIINTHNLITELLFTKNIYIDPKADKMVIENTLQKYWQPNTTLLILKKSSLQLPYFEEKIKNLKFKNNEYQEVFVKKKEQSSFYKLPIIDIKRNIEKIYPDYKNQ